MSRHKCIQDEYGNGMYFGVIESPVYSLGLNCARAKGWSIKVREKKRL